VYSERDYGVYAEYSHLSLATAVRDIIANLPDGRRDYHEAIRAFAETLYGKLGQNKDALYFLDKTPRYYFIIDEIVEIFPDAKFIFLFRNPLSVMASMIRSFHRNRLGDLRHRVDLLEGPRLLARGWERHKHSAIAVQYEDLVINPARTVGKIFEYLGMTASNPGSLLSDFSGVDLRGKMGDQIGTRQYVNVEPTTVEKWKDTLGSLLRKYYAMKYIESLGEEVVQSLGYDYHILLQDVSDNEANFDHIAGDLAWLGLCKVRTIFELFLLGERRKIAKVRGGRVYPHH